VKCLCVPLPSWNDGLAKRAVVDARGDGARLMVLVHHDDVTHEFAYGPDSKIGTFSDALLAAAKQRGWVVISMQSHWLRIFAFEQ
jgi:hypothetical protein